MHIAIASVILFTFGDIFVRQCKHEWGAISIVVAFVVGLFN